MGTLKYIAPQALAAAILSQGSIEELAQSRGASLDLSESNERQGQPGSRVLTASADSAEALEEVCVRLVETLDELAVSAPSDALCYDGLLKLSILVPRGAIGAIMGHGGQTIRQLTDDSGARIRVHEPAQRIGSEGSQEISLRGSAEALRMALAKVSAILHDVSREPWFTVWAAAADLPPTPQPRRPRDPASSDGGGGGWDVGRDGLTEAPWGKPSGMSAASAPARPARPAAAQEHSPRFCVKLLTPPAAVRAVLGHSGTAICDMANSCQAACSLADVSSCYPRTNLRVFTARADSEAALDEVVRRFVARISEAADSQGSDSGWFRVGTLVPKAAVAELKGPSREGIHKLQDATGSKIRCRDPIGHGLSATCEVSISSTVEGLPLALAAVHKKVHLLAGEPWFAAWAAAPNGVVPGTEKSPAAAAGIELVNRVMGALPDHVIEEARGFSMSCVVPERLVGPLLGRSGEGAMQVQAATGAKIDVTEIPGEPSNRSMSITGPLTSVSAAYILMMRRYLDAERLLANRG